MARNSQEKQKRTDFIPHGSDRHAALLGIRKATEDDDLSYKGWTLIDMTAFGPQATPTYLKEVLRQKVSTLETPMPKVQSDDQWEENYAPPMLSH